jgi:phage tail sheath protein FI
VAPANEPLCGVVALERPAAAQRWHALLNAQVNVIRQEPRGFLPMNADTLALDDDLRPIGVRRLLTLLRRAAMRAGTRWMFEPNDDTLRRGVERHFEAMLADLFRRGAFAGATAPAAFRVVADASLNTRASMDAGRFVVELRVAPSRPMTFLTIRLTQSGDRLVASGN